MNMERRLKEWIEKNTDRISGNNILNDLAHSLISIMKKHLVITSNGGCLAPSHYIVRLNPEDRMSPNASDKLTISLIQTLHLVALENEITFAHEPEIRLEYDPSIKKHKLTVDVIEKQGVEDTAQMTPPSKTSSEDQPGYSSIRYALKINDEELYPLVQLTTNIGRYPDNQLVISDPRISRHHAQLRMTEHRFILSDLNSTGGTFVNGKPITQCEIRPGDIISLAGFPLIFMKTIQT